MSYCILVFSGCPSGRRLATGIDILRDGAGVVCESEENRGASVRFLSGVVSGAFFFFSGIV